MASSRANPAAIVSWRDVDDMTVIDISDKFKQKMSIVMVQTAAGLKPPSGGYRGNYAHLQYLVRQGHDVAQTCWAFKTDIDKAIEELKSVGRYDADEFQPATVTMVNRNLNTVTVPCWRFTNVDGIKCFALNADVMLRTYPNNIQQQDAAQWIDTGEKPTAAFFYSNWLTSAIRQSKATHVIFNDAFGSRVAKAICDGIMPNLARVEIIHTLEQLPTGPFAGGISGGAMTPKELDLFKSVDAVVSVSQAVQKYAFQHCQLSTTLLYNHALSYMVKETGDMPHRRQNWNLQTIVMINPAWVKGYDIFLGMARENQARRRHNQNVPHTRKPTYNFVAYSAWGSDEVMRERLTAAGVRVLEAVEDMEPVYDEMAVLVMPSLWQEAWGITATEAQLRGIPVISSNVGGLPEAKLGVGPIVPVNPINGHCRGASGGYEIPAQDYRPFMQAVDRLMLSPVEYRKVSDIARTTTTAWLRNFDHGGMERLLNRIRKDV